MSHRSLERSAIAVAGALLLWLAWRLARSTDGAAALLSLAAAGLASFAAADLLSGLVHWLADRVLPEDLPYLGQHFVQPFREHHRDPLALARHGFAETNGNNCIAALPLLAALAARPDPEPAELTGIASSAFGLGLAGWICLTNQVHQWAHRARTPRLVASLQAWRLILSPQHHQRHHRAPFDRHFCITSGWFDPLLDGTGLFARIEGRLAHTRLGFFPLAGGWGRGTMRPPEGAPTDSTPFRGNSDPCGSERGPDPSSPRA